MEGTRAKRGEEAVYAAGTQKAGEPRSGGRSPGLTP